MKECAYSVDRVADGEADLAGGLLKHRHVAAEGADVEDGAAAAPDHRGDEPAAEVHRGLEVEPDIPKLLLAPGAADLGETADTDARQPAAVL